MYYYDQLPDMLFCHGLALLKLRSMEEANALFNKLVAFGEAHLTDDVKMDYFAIMKFTIIP